MFDVHKFLFMIRPAVVLAGGPPEAEHLKPFLYPVQPQTSAHQTIKQEHK